MPRRRKVNYVASLLSHHRDVAVEGEDIRAASRGARSSSIAPFHYRPIQTYDLVGIEARQPRYHCTGCVCWRPTDSGGDFVDKLACTTAGV